MEPHIAMMAEQCVSADNARNVEIKGVIWRKDVMSVYYSPEKQDRFVWQTCRNTGTQSIEA